MSRHRMKMTIKGQHSFWWWKERGRFWRALIRLGTARDTRYLPAGTCVRYCREWTDCPLFLNSSEHVQQLGERDTTSSLSLTFLTPLTLKSKTETLSASSLTLNSKKGSLCVSSLLSVFPSLDPVHSETDPRPVHWNWLFWRRLRSRSEDADSLTMNRSSRPWQHWCRVWLTVRLTTRFGDGALLNADYYKRKEGLVRRRLFRAYVIDLIDLCVQISEELHVWHLHTGFICGEKARVLESSSQRQHAFRREGTGRQNQFHWLRQAPSAYAALRRYTHKSSKYERSPTSNASSYSAMDRDSRLLRRLIDASGGLHEIHSFSTVMQNLPLILVSHIACPVTLRQKTFDLLHVWDKKLIRFTLTRELNTFVIWSRDQTENSCFICGIDDVAAVVVVSLTSTLLLRSHDGPIN